MIGDQLEGLCSRAINNLILVTPFVKMNTLTKILKSVNEDVNLCCVTRWRPEEIATGVSDIDVWPVLRDRWGRMDLIDTKVG